MFCFLVFVTFLRLPNLVDRYFLIVYEFKENDVFAVTSAYIGDFLSDFVNVIVCGVVTDLEVNFVFILDDGIVFIGFADDPFGAFVPVIYTEGFDVVSVVDFAWIDNVVPFAL